MIKLKQLIKENKDAYNLAKSEVSSLPFHKIIYAFSHIDYTNGLFSSLTHYGIDKTQSNWKKMTQAIKDRIQYLYSKEYGDVEYEYKNEKLYDNLHVLPDFVKKWPV